jgi:hypothetical protein
VQRIADKNKAALRGGRCTQFADGLQIGECVVGTRVIGDRFWIRDVHLGPGRELRRAVVAPTAPIAADDQDFADGPLFSKNESMIETPARVLGHA